MAGTLLDIRTAVVQDTGDFGLVGISGSSPDYTTDGSTKSGVLNRHINDAITFICDKVPAYAARQQYTVQMGIGQFIAQIPRLRNPTQVYVLERGTPSRTQLTPRDLDDLRDDYPEPWDLLDSGCPKYYAVSEHMEADSTELIVNTSSTNGPGWSSSGSGSTRTNYQITFVPGTFIVQKYLFEGVTAATPYAVQTRYGEITLRMYVQYTSPVPGDGDDGELFLQYYDIDNTQLVIAETINKSGWLNVTLPAGCPGFLINSHNAFNGSVVISNISARLTALGDTADLTNDLQTGKILLLMPPTDSARVLRVYGDFYLPALSANTDYNQLTKKRADVVVVGACWKWAQAQGLTALANHHAGHLAAMIRELNADIAEGVCKSLENEDGLILMVE